jgi:Tol biopolymer transport system component
MKDQPLLRFTFACAVFVLAVSTEIRAEIVYKIPRDFGWRRSLPLDVLFTCRFFPADRYGRVTGEFILDPNVVEDLGLSADVAHKLERLRNQILKEVDEERHKLPGDDPKKQPSDEILHTVRNRHMKELNELLTPQQQERLYQIHIQKRPRLVDTLSDSGVANAIGLTDAQRSQIHQLHWDVEKAEKDEIKSEARGVDYTGPDSNALYKACPEKIMKVLSDDQRQKFEKLRGASLLRAQGKPTEAEAGSLERLPGARMLAENCWKASFSPDGNRIVVGKMPEDSGLRIVDLTTGTTSDLLPYGKDPAWSPGDGRLIAFEHRGDEGDEVWIVEASGANPSKLAHGGFPSWSPDAKSVYFQSRKQHRLQVIALGAKGANATDVMDMAFLYPSVSPDGRQVAYRSENQLIIADLKTGKAAKTFPIDGGRGFAAGWSPDGKQIGYGGWGGGDPVPFSIVDIAAGRTVPFPNISGTMPAWSPDGSKMVFDVRTQRDRDIWLVETKALGTLTTPPKSPVQPAATARSPGIPSQVLAARDLEKLDPAAVEPKWLTLHFMMARERGLKETANALALQAIRHSSSLQTDQFGVLISPQHVIVAARRAATKDDRKYFLPYLEQLHLVERYAQRPLRAEANSPGNHASPQIRDLALGVLVQLSGKNPEDYGLVECEWPQDGTTVYLFLTVERRNQGFAKCIKEYKELGLERPPAYVPEKPPLFDYVEGAPPAGLPTSPGGKTRLLLNGSKAQLIDVATGKQIGKELNGRQTFNCHSFSPDGKYVATGSGYVWHNRDDPLDDVNHGFIDVWDAATGDRVEGMTGRRAGSVQAVGFSPDGKTIYYRAQKYARGNP